MTPQTADTGERERVLERVAIDENGCWIWQGASDDRGYGWVTADGKLEHAYRWTYRILVRPIPEGLTIDHLCRVPACVNPEHLEPVTLLENVYRQWGSSETHCRRGHEFTPENTKWMGPRHSTRRCRECALVQDRANHKKWRANKRRERQEAGQ